MSKSSDLFGGSRKSAHSIIISGTGTFVPSADNALCRFRIQAGGGGGYTSSSGGGAGAMVEVWLRVPIAGFSYSIGAGGAVAVDGSPTVLAQFTANPGRGSNTTSLPGSGGILGLHGGVVSSSAAQVSSGTLDGVAGGHGGYTTPAGQCGFPYHPNSGNAVSSTEDPGNGLNAGGGNSFFGKGGASGNAPATTSYGAGGGANAAGRGGCIDVEDYGA